jgi:hypothetical protein
LSLALVSCALDSNVELADESQAPAEPTAVAQEALDRPWGWVSPIWKPGQTPPPLADFDTHICVLTRVLGRFDGPGELVSVTGAPGLRWTLGGGAGANTNVSVRVACFPRAEFSSQNFGTGRFVSEQQTTRALPSSGCAQSTNIMWGADSAAIMMGIGGKFVGPGDWVQLGQAFEPFGGNDVHAGSCTPQGVWLYSRAFRVGQVNTSTVASFVPPFQGAPANAEFSVISTDEATNDFMVDVDKAMCYFTRITGRLRGDLAGDGAMGFEILKDTASNKWLLQATRPLTWGSGPPVEARARCLWRAQP